MQKKELLFIIGLLFIFNACAGTENSTENKPVTLSANAGDDKRVQINETITIKGEGIVSDKSELSYIWEKGTSTLGTSSIITYTPTVLGTDTLKLTVYIIVEQL